ncbi:MAG: trypsin-like peptidase domain-containing protein [Pseudomonadota bacterium]
MIRPLRAAAALACALWLALPAPAPAQTARVPDSQAEIQLSFAPVVKRAAPAVVNIYARRMAPRRASPFQGDPFFERFFQGLMPRGRSVQNSLGSGVIVSADGLVVSNHHVVGGAEEIRVVLADRREFDAQVLLSDPESDLAILRLDGAADLPFLRPRPSRGLEVGDLVLAIGNPFGVGQTVTSGIVSALARTRAAPQGGVGYFIQTDAPINPGNSGGALVDMRGRLIGVNTAIVTRSGGSNGIGFAVPAELVEQVVAQARAGRSTLARPWGGLAGQAVDGALSEALGLETPMGLVVAQLHPASPFAAAGLARGDVLLSLDNQPVAGPEEFDFRLAALGLGAQTTARWLSDGKRRRAEVTLGAAPDEPPRDPRRLGRQTALPGLQVANLNPALGEELGAPLGAEGVVVVDPGPVASRVGFRRGDVLLAFNGEPLDSPGELVRLARERPAAIAVDILRDGRRGTLRFRL